jgi:hypothetical protein
MTSSDSSIQITSEETDAAHHGIVTITVDNKPVQIHRGQQSVAEIKSLGGVPAAFDLDEVVAGKLVPLPDGGHVVIKGEEVFLSHPKSGHSS